MINFRQKIKKIKKVWLKLEKIILILIILELSFPQHILAKTQENQIESEVSISQTSLITEIKLPIIEEIKSNYKTKVLATAYNSLQAQTDASPCITASGLDVCQRNLEDIIAANFLPFGTKIKIPELYGDRIFYVQDRMNKKYYKQIDIWLKSYQDAKNFGYQYVEIEVY